MISPELLRRFPFFGFMNDAEARAIAMNTEEEFYVTGEAILVEGQVAQALYFLIEGGCDLFYTVIEDYHPDRRKEFPVGEINAGEPFGISALIEPNVLTSTVRASQNCRVLRIDALAIKTLIEVDKEFAYQLTSRIAKTALERLHATRIQLAAAWA